MRNRPHALIQLSSPLIHQASPRVAEFTLKNRLPAISMFRDFAEAGGLMAYGRDLLLFFRRAGAYIDRILKGAKPGDLPAEQPGLTIPPSLLLRADRVIE
jgi:putative ABC transport system substrate-binding protein